MKSLRKMLALLLCLCLFAVLIPAAWADHQIVMTASEFIDYLQYVVDRGDSKYGSGGVMSVGKYQYDEADGKYKIYFDCNGLGESIIATRGQIVYNRDPNLNPWNLWDTSCGIQSAGDSWFEGVCIDKSSDFSNLVPGEWLIKRPNPNYWHFGYYIGNGKVIESTVAGENKVQVSTIDSSGHDSLQGSYWTWDYHAKAPWINYTTTYLDKCNVYPTNITVKTNVNVNLKSLPCSQDTDPNSTTLTQIPSGKSFTVTELYRNDYDHYDKCWYKVSYNGKEGYIYSGHTVVTEYGDNTVSVSGGTSAPTTLPENQGYFATWLINSNHLWIDTVRGYIFDRNTGAVIPGYPSEKTGIRAMSYQLGSENRNEPVDAGLHFSTLSPGDYFCIIEVTTHCYYGASDGSLQTKATNYHPIDFSFKKEGSANLSSGAGRPIPDGTYIIASYADPQYYIDIEGSGYPAENGANVGLWGPRDGTLPEYDTWTVTYINDGNGFYFITQPNTEMALSACGSTTKSGDNIAVYPFRQLDAQKWSIVQNENGSYSIRAKCSGNCIDISGKISETCNIQQWEANYGVYQQWIFIPNGDLESYTVSYNANGGTDAPANQVKLYNIDLILSSDQPKRADTSAESFIVTLDANDGSGSSTSLTAERTTKYTFKNWKANDSDRSYGAGDIYKTNAPVTLNAQWDSSTETAAVILPAPTRDDHVFLGWATSSTAKNPQYGAGSRFTPDSDVTLYAVWEKGTFTDWSETRPEGVDESLIETKTQYRYRNKETTTGTESTMDGWILESTEKNWGDYGPWSDWDTDAVTASDDRQVETTALYKYYYFYCPVCGGHEPFTGKSDCGSYTLSGGDWHETWSTIPYSECSYGTFSYTTAKYYTTALGDGQVWCFSSGNLYDTAVGTYDTTSDDVVIKQGYRYRTRTLETQYTFYRWNDWSSWSDLEAVASDNCEVETRTLYRYLIKDFTVTYNANSGANAPEPQTKTQGTALTLSSTIPTRADWYFLGWAESADATEAAYLPGGIFTKDADTTLYAVWTQPDFVLPAALTTIENEAFANCAFRFAALSENITEIQPFAFSNCGNMKTIYIPVKNAMIDKDAFTGVAGLTILGVSGGNVERFANGKGFDFIAVP